MEDKTHCYGRFPLYNISDRIVLSCWDCKFLTNCVNETRPPVKVSNA